MKTIPDNAEYIPFKAAALRAMQSELVLLIRRGQRVTVTDARACLCGLYSGVPTGGWFENFLDYLGFTVSDGKNYRGQKCRLVSLPDEPPPMPDDETDVADIPKIPKSKLADYREYFQVIAKCYGNMTSLKVGAQVSVKRVLIHTTVENYAAEFDALAIGRYYRQHGWQKVIIRRMVVADELEPWQE